MSATVIYRAVAVIAMALYYEFAYKNGIDVEKDGPALLAFLAALFGDGKFSGRT